MNKITIAIVLIFFTYSSFAQRLVAVINLESGEQIEAFSTSNSTELWKIRGLNNKAGSGKGIGPIGFTVKAVHYFDKEGELIGVEIDKVKNVVIGDESFKFVKINYKKRNSRMVQLIAENERYLLTNYTLTSSSRDINGFQSMNPMSVEVFSIYDKTENELVEKKIMHSMLNKKNLSKKALSKVEKYFGDCTELISTMKTNFETQVKFGLGGRINRLLYRVEGNTVNGFINNYKCD